MAEAHPRGGDSNPYLFLLIFIAILVLLAGLIVWIWGLVSATTGYGQEVPNDALARQAAGTGIMGVGAVAFFIWLAAAGIAWQQREFAKKFG